MVNRSLAISTSHWGVLYPVKTASLANRIIQVPTAVFVRFGCF